MAGPNTTGTPNTEDYNLGRGKLYFSALTASLPGAWRDMGNCPEFNLSIEVETLEHQSSREGLKVVDKEVTISQKLTCTFTLDEVNDENLAAIFSGEKASYTNAAVAGFASYEAIESVELGRWYEIKDSNGVRAYDIDTADLDVDNGTDDTDCVEGTDYTLNLDMGLIFFHSDATGIVAGEAVDLTLTADAGAKEVHEVRGLTQTGVVGALKFVSENPANNDKMTEFNFHKITLKGDGDFSLIGDDWTQMPFTAAAEKNETASPDSPTLTIRTVGTAPA